MCARCWRRSGNGLVPLCPSGKFTYTRRRRQIELHLQRRSTENVLSSLRGPHCGANSYQHLAPSVCLYADMRAGVCHQQHGKLGNLSWSPRVALLCVDTAPKNRQAWRVASIQYIVSFGEKDRYAREGTSIVTQIRTWRRSLAVAPLLSITTVLHKHVATNTPSTACAD